MNLLIYILKPWMVYYSLVSFIWGYAVWNFSMDGKIMFFTGSVILAVAAMVIRKVSGGQDYDAR